MRANTTNRVRAVPRVTEQGGAETSRRSFTLPDAPRARKKTSAPVERGGPPRVSWMRRTGPRARSALVGAMLVGGSLGLAGCGASDHSALSVPRPSSTVAVEAPVPSTSRPVPPPKTPAQLAEEELDAALRAQNVRLEYDRDFPDPFVLRDGEATYFYATNAHGANVPVLDARAMLDGAPPIDALPNEGLGSWAIPNISHVWAPTVARVEDGRYALFYSAKEASSGWMAVGVAYASSPLGPFEDASPTPLLSASKSGAAGAGGVIDASVFQENGRTFVVYKNDGNSSGLETAVWIQEFSAAQNSVLGEPVKILGDFGHQAWEEAHYTRPHALIEGPRLVENEGKYYLFYCANDWASEHYGVNYAVADSLFGPYTRAPGPWMRSEERSFGPGGPEIFAGPDGGSFLAYHAWRTPAADPGAGDARRLVIEPLVFTAGTPDRVLVE